MPGESTAQRTAPDRRVCPRGGQAMLETLLVMLVLCLLFFGLLQVALVFNAHEVLHHSAARAARARAVGFNDWMTTKAQRVAAIPNSGRMLEPEALTEPVPFLDPDRSPGANWDRAVSRAAGLRRSPRTAIELSRIPEYLASDNHLRAEEILNYEEWDRQSFELSAERSGALAAALGGSGTLHATVRQRFPLWMPLHELIYRGTVDADGVDRITLSGESEVLDHASLYLH